jgi:Lipoate synthase
LGETKKEVLNTMSQVIDIGVEIFSIGQFFLPTKNLLPVSRYVDEDEF